VGATERDILQQFLSEAVFLTVIGGLVGIALGASLSFLVSVVLSSYLNLAWNFTFPITASIIGISVSGAIGLIFGIYPARQASKKSPIEALRYE
jgi:putative ABC transport system permease protein